MLITIGAMTIVEKGGMACGYRRLSAGPRPPHVRRGGMTSGIWLIGVGVLDAGVADPSVAASTITTRGRCVVILSGIIMLMRGIR